MGSLWAVEENTASDQANSILQVKEITGRILDAETNQPLPGVTVVVVGTTKGTVSNTNGEYSISVSSLDDVLMFSMVGYVTQEIRVGDRKEINVEMAVDVKALEEVIVVGYGTQKKSDLTGAITSLDEKSFNKGAAVSPDQLIQGKVAGVQTVPLSGEPGSGMAINIRGAGSINASNSPLYVVDGIPINNEPTISAESYNNFTRSNTPRNPLRTINPADIASISILKGASAAAIYGARGANGVVIIETKSGQQGKVNVNYDTYVGFQNVAKKLDLLTPEEYQMVINDIIDEGGGDPTAPVTEIQDGGTDWQDEIFKENALIQQHNLSFSGGNEATTYFVSLNYMNQEGVVIDSKFERFGARLNLDHKTEKFNFGINLSNSFSIDDEIPNGWDGGPRLGVISAALSYDPSIAVKDENGDYIKSPYFNFDNPVALARGKQSIENGYRTIGTIYGEYFILPEFSAKVKIGTDILSQRRDIYIDRTTLTGNAQGGIAYVLNGNAKDYLIEGTVNYNKSFGNHEINAVAGITTEQYTADNISSEAYGFPSDITQAHNFGLADPTSYTTWSNKISSRLLSYIGRVNYKIKNTYLLTATMRIDGSSKFGENNKFGYFPSFAAAWKIHEEDFFSSISNTISTLKLRASWGQTGNQEIGNYQSITTFGSGQTIIYDDQQISTSDPTRMGNPDLKWETNQQTDIGLSFGLFQNRINGEIDYYRRLTTDMLLNIPVPSSNGFSTQLRNTGEMLNTGFEFFIDANIVTGVAGGVNWDVNFSLSTLRNEVLDLGEIDRIYGFGRIYDPDKVIDGAITEPGLPLYSFYGYEVMGIWQEDDDFSQITNSVSPGDLKYRDVNGDKTINADDRVVLGNSFPDFQGSFGTSLGFKNFSLDVFFQAETGFSIYNQILSASYNPPSHFRGNRLAEPLLNRWTPENPSEVYPQFDADEMDGLVSDAVQDGSYLRLSYATLSYNFPRTTIFRSTNIYLSAQNLFTLTNYEGYDPAMNSNGNTTFRADKGSYPLTRNFMVGLRIGF
ncbi:MAG: TonB-dependent receptor [Bacteroidales bacterium]|nr:TonB-dependent receptor [Bacteroidales bacterium]